jgi:hypothetical protein
VLFCYSWYRRHEVAFVLSLSSRLGDISKCNVALGALVAGLQLGPAASRSSLSFSSQQLIDELVARGELPAGSGVPLSVNAAGNEAVNTPAVAQRATTAPTLTSGKTPKFPDPEPYQGRSNVFGLLCFANVSVFGGLWIRPGFLAMCFCFVHVFAW